MFNHHKHRQSESLPTKYVNNSNYLDWEAIRGKKDCLILIDRQNMNFQIITAFDLYI